MKKPFAIGVLLAAVLMAGGTLWRESEARTTRAEVGSPPARALQLVAGGSPSVDAALPGASAIEISGAITLAEDVTVAAASQMEDETVDEMNGDRPTDTEPVTDVTTPSPQPSQVTAPQPQPVARPQNQPAPLPARGVFHGQAEYAVTIPGQEQRPATQAEFWIDLETGDARITEKEAGSSNEVVRVRRGVNQTMMFPQDKRARTEVAPDEQSPYLNAIRDGVLSYRTALDQGAFVILAEETVSGQLALRVRPLGPGPDLSEIYLSRDFGLPVKEVTYRPTQTGGREEAQTRTTTYRGVEILSRAQLPADHFAPSIPSDWEYVTTRTLDLAGAGAFRLFDLYWLGTEYSGMNLARMYHDEVVQGSNRINVVIVDYAQLSTDPQAQATGNRVTVRVAQPLTSEEQTARTRGGLPPGGEQVTVNGRRGVVFTLQPPQGGNGQPDVSAAQAPPTVLELPMERALVVVIGKDSAQVTQVARDLQKIN